MNAKEDFNLIPLDVALSSLPHGTLLLDGLPGPVKQALAQVAMHTVQVSVAGEEVSITSTLVVLSGSVELAVPGLKGWFLRLGEALGRVSEFNMKAALSPKTQSVVIEHMPVSLLAKGSDLGLKPQCTEKSTSAAESETAGTGSVTVGLGTGGIKVDFSGDFGIGPLAVGDAGLLLAATGVKSGDGSGGIVLGDVLVLWEVSDQSIRLVGKDWTVATGAVSGSASFASDPEWVDFFGVPACVQKGEVKLEKTSLAVASLELALMLPFFAKSVQCGVFVEKTGRLSASLTGGAAVAQVAGLMRVTFTSMSLTRARSCTVSAPWITDASCPISRGRAGSSSPWVSGMCSCATNTPPTSPGSSISATSRGCAAT